MKLEGITTQVIKHKLALRIVQNCHIHFNNVILPDDSKMPKANDFVKGTNQVLKHSRTFVCWIACGIAQGVYDNTQAMILQCWRISKLVDEGKATMGQIALTKAWVTERGREVVRLGREMMGGNGIIFDNYNMKALGDMEAIYTY